MTTKNAQIPKDLLPLVVLHWRDEWYYGFKGTVLDFRKEREAGIRDSVQTQCVIDAWVQQAREWEAKNPKKVAKMLNEYHAIKLAA